MSNFTVTNRELERYLNLSAENFYLMFRLIKLFNESHSSKMGTVLVWLILVYKHMSFGVFNVIPPSNVQWRKRASIVIDMGKLQTAIF